MLLGSVRVKAVSRTLVKLTPARSPESVGITNPIQETNTKRTVVNFINVKRANFTYESLFSSYVLALNELSYERLVGKSLMKLTPDGR